MIAANSVSNRNTIRSAYASSLIDGFAPYGRLFSVGGPVRMSVGFCSNNSIGEPGVTSLGLSIRTLTILQRLLLS